MNLKAFWESLFRNLWRIMINHYHVDILSNILKKKHLKYSAGCCQGHWRSVPGKGVKDVKGGNVATQHGPCVAVTFLLRDSPDCVVCLRAM